MRGRAIRCRYVAPGPLGSRPARFGFTLVELLVVIAIIGLLVGLLIPVLGKARASGRLSICRARLSQLGLAVIVYAGQHGERIPRGPTCAGPFDFVCADVATNQLWIGAGNEAHPNEAIGLGVLMKGQARNPEVYFCPADDSNNLEEELSRIGSDQDAYGSYTYRQLDQLPAVGKAGVLSRLGVNVVGDVKVPVEALALDTNSLGPGQFRHTNHDAKKVNVLYRDRSIRAFSNELGTFSIPAKTFAAPMDIFTRLDQILVNADYGYRHDPAEAPQLVEGRQ